MYLVSDSILIAADATRWPERLLLTIVFPIATLLCVSLWCRPKSYGIQSMEVMNSNNKSTNTIDTVTVSGHAFLEAVQGNSTNVKCKVNENGSREGKALVSSSIAINVLNVERELSAQLSQLAFSPPVAYVYNPLDYAWETHSLYVTKYCNTKKQILFVGMNPGPWGMVQTGIPFGEVRVVQDWLGVIGSVGQPQLEHPQRRVQGFQCPRTEVSGQRFWGFFRDICGSPENLFKHCFVHSYCPLSFMHSSARNITPPELKSSDRQAITALCDAALAKIITALQVGIVIGIGKFAEYRIRETVKMAGMRHVTVGCLLHPSPINPAANKGWKEAALKYLQEMNILHIVRGEL